MYYNTFMFFFAKEINPENNNNFFLENVNLK